MADEIASESSIDAFVEQDLHFAAAASMHSFASSRNAITCSRETLGKPSRKSSIESPASRWSMSVGIGTRVPAKQGAPLMISGSIFTTEFISFDRRSFPTTSSQMRYPTFPWNFQSTSSPTNFSLVFRSDKKLQRLPG